MKKIKVVHIVESLGAGTQSHLQSLTDFFSNKNTSIINYILFSSNREEFNMNTLNSFSKKVIFKEINMHREISLIKDIKSGIEIYKELKNISPDVIHLHSSKAGIIGRFSSFFIKSKKLFYSPHGYSFMRLDVSSTKRYLFKIIEKTASLFLGGKTIACGDTEFLHAKNIGKAELIRNGIDLDYLTPFFFKPKNKKLTIGIIGRITYARNPKLFNEIANKFSNYNFIWIGDGELRNEINAPNIAITGWIDNKKDAIEKLSNIDIYLHPSLWEGLPIAILEAMALQKPVIATNIIGNKDIVKHNETGFLFNDIKELDAHFKFLESEENREKMGQKGLNRCQDLFNSNENFKKLETLYLS